MYKIDPFCYRQFNKGQFNYIDYDMKKFEQKLNQYYQIAQLIDGYAQFCKIFYIQNFINLPKSVVQITPQNQHLLVTSYEARNQKQLPVLRRYFPKQKIETGIAKYLYVILYDKERVEMMDKAMGQIDPNKDIDYDFGIIAIKPQDFMYTLPMEPITMMRNGLGDGYGGSGHKIQRQKYIESVEFWKKHALIK